MDPDGVAKERSISEEVTFLKSEISQAEQWLRVLKDALAEIRARCPHERTRTLSLSMDYTIECLDCGRCV
jgi:hypothetical protein